ncbi:MAG: hypothetical protein AAF654_06050 [Myxococcota bacterium]
MGDRCGTLNETVPGHPQLTYRTLTPQQVIDTALALPGVSPGDVMSVAYDTFQGAPIVPGTRIHTLSPQLCIARDLFAGVAEHAGAGVQLRRAATYNAAVMEENLGLNAEYLGHPNEARHHYRQCAAKAGDLPEADTEAQSLAANCADRLGS